MTIFSDALNITLSGWTRAGGAPLTVSDKAAIADYLTNTLHFDSYANNLLANNPASLAAGEVGAANAIPIVYSGSEQAAAAQDFINRAAQKAYTIGDTQYGIAVEASGSTVESYLNQLQQWASSSNSGLGGKLEYNGSAISTKGYGDTPGITVTVHSISLR
jgi:hypothetical protein